MIPSQGIEWNFIIISLHHSIQYKNKVKEVKLTDRTENILVKQTILNKITTHNDNHHKEILLNGI